MKNARNRHRVAFKARVALEAIRRTKTVSQIAADNDLLLTQVTQWKTQMFEGAAGAFDAGRTCKPERDFCDQLEQRVERKMG